VLRTIGRFTGVETLEGLAELLSCFQGMYEGFRDRAKAVRLILGDPKTSFVVVGAPRPSAITDARGFYRRLREEKITVGAFLLNRATVDPFLGGPIADSTPLKEAVRRASGSPALGERLIAVAEEASRAAQSEQVAVEQLRRTVPGIPVVVVPELSTDVHDLSGLDALRQHLFPSIGQ
jgi:anion-transporting  ArsA/GET3 family ATPase